MKGIKVFEGVAIGEALVHKSIQLDQLVRQVQIADDQVADEVQKFQTVVAQGAHQIERLRDHALETVGEEEAQIFDAHLMMLEDPMLIDAIKKSINSEGLAVDWAILKTRDALVEQFMAIENDYIRARAQDILDVTDRLLQICLGIEAIDLSEIKQPTIIVAQDLKPSETVLLNDQVVGIILEEGSVTSHAAIVAKAKGIPTIVGVANACTLVQTGATIILDAAQEIFYVNPEAEKISAYKARVETQKAEQQRLNTLKDLAGETPDGKTIKLYGNVGSFQEAQWVREQGSKGIGLLRTELIYMESDHLPTEEEQTAYYKSIVELMPEETIIRTLDIGGDKQLPYYQFQHETNPFLGERAIRLCLREQDIFLTQLRAILRASHYGKTKIMFPMISCLEEVHSAKTLLEQAKNSLKMEDVPFDKNIQVGMMIEIPSAAISADIFAEEVDFFSIGTNDLCQYTSAVDRMNPHVADLYQPLHPSILRLISITIEAAKKAGIEIGVCGEMAGEPGFAQLLMGMGVDELSMSASIINRVKDRIRTTNFTDMVALLERIQQTKTAEAAMEILKGDRLC